MTISARTATLDDVPEIARVINEAYRVEDFFVRGNRTSDIEVRDGLLDRDACFLVIDGDRPGTLQGAVWVQVTGERGYFAMLAVASHAQMRGLGRTLVSAAEQHCTLAGCTTLDIDVVNLREELPAFYAQFGYHPSGEGAFPTPERLRQPAHLIVMSKSLVSATP